MVGDLFMEEIIPFFLQDQMFGNTIPMFQKFPPRIGH